MKLPRLVRCLLIQLVLVPALEADEPERATLSPDGRFRFEAFSAADYDAGKRPAFGIVETATGRLVSNPQEDLGDPTRPEETILWAPDSLSYALTSRVGTRHLDTFLYRWDGTSFVRAKWEGDGTLEESADLEMEKDIAALGLPADSGLGQCIRGDDLAERWLDPSRLVLTCVLEYSVGNEDRGGIARGESRAIVKWDEPSQSYQIERALENAPPRVPAIGDGSPLEVKQTDRPGDDPNARTIVVRHRESGETKSFDAENWMTSPTVKIEANGWPQIELVSHGPSGFVWHRLYRLIDGAYRCHRIEELTRHAGQAPEGAPLVEVSPGNSLFLIRSRRFQEGDPESFESFQTESLSPDGKWKTVSTYHPQYLQRVAIVDAEESAEPVVIYDFDDGDGWIDAAPEVLWRPDGGAFAFYLQEGPRVSRTLLYRRTDRVWSESPTSEIDYGFLKDPIESGATWGHQHERPLWWKGEGELMLELSGFFKGDDGIDYLAHALLRWNENGDPVGGETIPIGQP
jgi:hypothetical protein